MTADREACKAITQKDIAGALGISRGTVDRALHNRAGIDRELKAKILHKAEELGYSPNRLAQFLVTGRTVNLAMIVPSDPLWREVKRGAASFLAGIGNLILNIRWHETGVHNPVRETEILKRVMESGVDGIGIAPADPLLLTEQIDRLVEKNTAVVTLNTDAPESRRLCFVGQDPVVAGRIGAELLAKFLAGRGRVVIVTAFEKVLVHRQRLNAFREVMEELYPGIEIAAVYENHDREEESCRLLDGHLARNGNIDGIFLTTGNGPAGAVQALRAKGLEGRVRVVCFDFFPETVKLLKSGLIHAAIGEDPFSQGYQAVKILCEYILEKKRPASRIVHTRIDIGLRENIDLLVSGRDACGNS